jgi:transcriptional regulator with GAF, ATPase, and Fis domain
MKKPFNNLVLDILFLSIVLNSCVVLKSVNNFSSTSLNGIKKFEDINYSFQQHCIDKCQFDLMHHSIIKREEDIVCRCDSSIMADKITQLIYNSIQCYLSGLTNLSDNKLTDYKYNTLEKSLTQGPYADKIIEKEQIAAYTRISEILSKAATDHYRKNKINKYIAEANDPIKLLLSKFQFIQRNLWDELKFRKEELFQYYQNLVENSTLSEYEKNKATADYYQKLSEIDAKQKQIEAFAKSLNSISEGHQKLNDNINILSPKDLKVLLSGYASDIQDLVSEFNKLKK